MTVPSAFTPLRKTVVVKAPPERAFHRFTAEIATWWPLRSHSVGQTDAETVVLEGRVGGRIVERIRGWSRSARRTSKSVSRRWTAARAWSSSTAGSSAWARWRAGRGGATRSGGPTFSVCMPRSVACSWPSWAD